MKTVTPDLQSLLISQYVIAALVSSMIGAIGGSLLAAYLKERWGDKFLKRRRLREIRMAVNFNIANLFRVARLYVTYFNMITMFRAQMNTVEPDDDDDSITDKKVFFGKLCADQLPSMSDQYNKMSEYESQLLSLSYECEAYLKKAMYRQLVRFIRQITDLTIRQDFAVLDYRGMSMEQIQFSWETQMDNLILIKIRELDREYQRIADEINGILK